MEGNIATPAPVPVGLSASLSSPSATTPGLKEPPPEKAEDVRRRSFVILSFWLVVLLLGLPIWWHTTAIPRAHLPLSEMHRWADGRACRPVFPLRIAVHASTLPEAQAQNLIRLTQHALDDLNDFDWHHLRLELVEPADTPIPPIAAVEYGETKASDQSKISDLAAVLPAVVNDHDAALTIRLTPGEPLSASLHPHLPILEITYPLGSAPAASSASSSSPLATFIARELRATFAEERAILSDLLTANVNGASTGSRTSSSSSLRYAPTYHLTFSLFSHGSSPNQWEIESAVDTYMRPILDVLRPIHNFTIDTQVQLYATPGVQKKSDNQDVNDENVQQQRKMLEKEDLASFINAAEWPLSPSIGGAPTVNFIVYVDSSDDLTIGPNASRSWMIPQWGSVYLLPGTSLSSSSNIVTADLLRQPLLTFTSHLLILLGVPDPSPLSYPSSLPLRLSSLSRVRAADLLLRASSSLGSLARLSLALPSISIPGTVADGVGLALHHLELACATLNTSEKGLHHARVAEHAAERAFFEKSMVGQLYFPDEHKIAVYLPLLGPIGVPLLMGALNEFKQWYKRRRAAAAAADAERRDRKSVV